MTLSVIALILGLAASTQSPPHVEWSADGFEKALEQAKRENKLVFIDLWAGWCGACKRFDQAVLSDAAVVAEMRDFVCLKVDAESAAGVPLAARYGATELPALVFLEADGTLRERLAGFRPAPQFVLEIRRVRANDGTLGEIEKRLAANGDDLLARLDLAARLKRMRDPKWELELQSVRDRMERGVGFDPKSPEDRFAIARKLRQCGDEKGYQAQLAAIRELDPEGRSEPMRRLALNALIEDVNARYRQSQVFDPSPIRSFLADEKSPLVLFEGYSMLRSMTSFQAEDARRRKLPELAARLSAEAREQARLAWQNCPADRLAYFGREIAEDLLADPELDAPTFPFLIDVATRASQAAPRSADHLEVLGRCLERAQKPEEAASAYRKALEFDPSNESVRRRLEKLAPR